MTTNVMEDVSNSSNGLHYVRQTNIALCFTYKNNKHETSPILVKCVFFKIFHLKSTGVSCSRTFTGIFQEDNIPDIGGRDKGIMIQCPVSWSGETEIRISKRRG